MEKRKKVGADFLVLLYSIVCDQTLLKLVQNTSLHPVSHRVASLPVASLLPAGHRPHGQLHAPMGEALNKLDK